MKDEQQLMIANQRSEEHHAPNLFKKNTLNVDANLHGENLDLGLIGNHIPRHFPVHNTISQTPRLKANSYRSPILDPTAIAHTKRASSLLDHDLAFMSTSVLQDQDELVQQKLEGDVQLNELNLDMEFGVEVDPGLDALHENAYDP